MEAAQKKMSPSKYDLILKQSKELKSIQETDDPPHVVATIPTLGLKDIDSNGVEYPIEIAENSFNSSVTVIKNLVESSHGVAYIDFGIDVSQIEYDDMELLPLITYIMTEADLANNMTRVDFDRQIGKYTGGIYADILVLSVLSDIQKDVTISDNTVMRSLLFLRGKCTVQNVGKMLDLFSSMTMNSSMNQQDKVKTILESKISKLVSRIAANGHSYSVKRMHSRYNVNAQLNEKLYGVSQLQTLRDLVEKANNDWDSLRERLEKVMQIIVQSVGAGTVINLTGESKTFEVVEESLENFIASFPNGSIIKKFTDPRTEEHPWALAGREEMPEVLDEGIAVASQVSYVGEMGVLYEHGERASGSSLVPLQYLKKGYLWETVREQNGAYGVMSDLDRSDGTMYMVSYRDPTLSDTLDAFNDAADNLIKDYDGGEIDKDTITKSVIGTIGSIDGTALPPDMVGWKSMLRWMSGVSAASRQKVRQEIINAQGSDFLDFATRLKGWKSTSIAVVGSEANFDHAKEHENVELEVVVAY
jgi:Zn-dependent M16 (insulinase) family peptidase